MGRLLANLPGVVKVYLLLEESEGHFRWTATGTLWVEAGFRKVRGHGERGSNRHWINSN